MQYPSGEHVAYRFDDNGYLIEDYQRFTDGSEQSLRIIDEYSAFGSINQQTFSNNYVQQFSRNLAGSPTSICTSSSAGCSTIGVQYLNYDYDGMGNLAFQHNVITQFKESYNYDELMRVDDSTKTYKGITYDAVNYDYDAAGNILVKGDYGSQYLYGSVGKGAGGNAGPNAIRQFIRGGTKTFTYDNNGNRLTGDGVTLSYNDQNKPLTVDRNNVKSIFSYDANGNRYKQVKQQSGSVVSTTYYVGSFEREVALSSTVDKTYIGDHTIKMKAHVGSLGNQSPFQHVLRDHLGSVDTLMDAKTGAVLQHRGYDVFGRPRDIAAGNNLLTSWQGVTKGYTDHEHLNEQELIHMNGRIYDFNIGRFLSVDPFLQFPENSQSANPYSYILNNPMSGVDPTGYSAVRSGNASAWATNEFMGDMYSFHKTVEVMQYNKAMKALKKSTSNGEKNEEKSTGSGSKKHEDEGNDSSSPKENAAKVDGLLDVTPSQGVVQSEDSTVPLSNCIGQRCNPEKLGSEQFGLFEFMNDKRVQSKLNKAWEESNPGAPEVNRGALGSKKKEQGGWIVKNKESGALDVIRVPSGTRDQIKGLVGSRPTSNGLEVLAWFHTHPNSETEGYPPRSLSGGDIGFHKQEAKVPGVIITDTGYYGFLYPMMGR
ncbi:RHS repeat domain-containing protein [Shewanella algicola]|uniref:RHS repeat domain-containing protein n=1 Tax=Shewanella algicola TaxID=640633 RepID=UPI002495022B|nr:RHS repeat-associated core domain-containing protein [Shewanella algicola]